ncbi:hypothetical protein [Cupriavidus yeoncheonensis]|uniref:hypothetical protein n=1 Tax=Cupriavidus yeoncheonensis TaxID=1462994 RepID=UPI001BA73BED|nr:hypothetical protein [Cupriavidus yeoncheonensis]
MPDLVTAASCFIVIIAQRAATARQLRGPMPTASSASSVRRACSALEHQYQVFRVFRNGPGLPGLMVGLAGTRMLHACNGITAKHTRAGLLITAHAGN